MHTNSIVGKVGIRADLHHEKFIEAYNWGCENCSEFDFRTFVDYGDKRISLGEVMFFFTNEEDATVFKLMWGEICIV